MKKTLLILVAGILSINVFAQMPDGSTGPNFQTTDILGNSIDLYADFLDQGIPVVMDISATWCGPCWSFHDGHALKNLYMSHGPAGSNEVGVIFVEGDGSTGLPELYGTGGSTLGDWVTGTPYPILDNANIANQYQIAYYPTVYGICPDRTVYEIGTGNPTQLLAALQSNCSSVNSFTGSQDNVGVDQGAAQVCIAGGSVTPTATVHNFGTNMVMNMTAELFAVGNPTAIDVQNWSGVLSSGSATNIQFSPLTNIMTAADYYVTVSNPNGNTDNYPMYNTSDYNVTISDFTTSTNIEVFITLDNYPGETTWRLVDGNGTILSSAGPYQGNGTSAGGADAGQTYNYPVTLPAGTDCYELIVDDSYGDGLSLSAGGVDAGYRVNDGSVDVIASGANPAFGSSVTESFASSASSSSINEILTDGISVYPNPTSQLANVYFNLNKASTVSVNLLNVLGQKMSANTYTMSAGSQKIEVDVNNFITGVYFLELNVNGESITQKITVTK